MNWKITIGLIAAFTLVSCYIVYDKQQRKVKRIQIELDMTKAELGVFKDARKDERNQNNEFGRIVNQLKDSINYLESLAYSQNEKIAQLQREKNEIIRETYSKHSDSDLSKLLYELFAETDSMP